MLEHLFFTTSPFHDNMQFCEYDFPHRATFDDSLQNQDPSSSHQSQFEEQRGPVPKMDSSQDSQLPVLPDVIPEPSEGEKLQPFLKQKLQ